MYSLASSINEEKWDIVDFIAYADSIGLDGVELLDIYWKDKQNKQAELTQVKEALNKHDLLVSAYDVTNNFVKDSRVKRTEEVEKVKDGIRVAKQLGTDIVRVFCGDLSGDLTYEEGQGWIVESLKECATLAEQEKVYLAIENHGLLAGKSKQVEDIIRKVNSPFVKSTFDTGNFLLVHEKPSEAFDRLKQDIIHVHFKDFRKKTSKELVNGFKSLEGVELYGTIPGDGEVDLFYIVNGLIKQGYDGWLSIEYEGMDDAKEANEEAVNRLQRLLM
nr:sugar phosphate isomerase/epimerase family protein [Thalassobacillus sp. CUG 92003]